MTILRCHLSVLFLTVGLANGLVADDLSPVEVCRQFQIALALKDEATIRRLALPDPNLAVLWQGEKPDIEQLNAVYLSYKELKIVQLQPGETFSVGGHELTVTSQMANGTRALVRRLIPGRDEPPLPMVRAKGRWRMDARPFILPLLSQAGETPRTTAPEDWKGVMMVDEFLARSPRIWDARLVDLSQSSASTAFALTLGDEPQAVFTSAEGSPAPTLFDQPLQAYALRFQDGLLARVEATVYDAATTTAPLTGAQLQTQLDRLDRNLRRLTGSKGRFRKKERDPADRTRTVRAKEWEALGMLLRMEVVTTSEEAIQALRFVATETTPDPQEALAGDRSLPGEVRDALAKLGTPVSPAGDRFWQQTRTGFLGGFVSQYNVHWTEEQETEGLAAFRSCYVQSPRNENREGKPVLLVRNEPLLASHIALFGHPVVAMVATFRDDRLVEFRFDFWNKGDGAAKDDRGQAKGLPEEDGKAACEDTLNLLRQAGLEFARTTGSQSRISRVRETRYTADVGPTRLTFIVGKEEYYSLLLQSTRFLAAGDRQPRDRPTARDTREDAKEQVIRITTEKEASQYPGDVEVGDVFLPVPMVDQGPKGYCAPATLARVVQYYGHQTTLNEMAAMMETQGGDEGTQVSDVLEGVRKVTRRLHLSFKEEDLPDRGRLDNQRQLDRWVATAIIAYIDNGNPIFWTVPMHQRLIVGYNARTRELLSSDSWGQKGYDRISYLEAAQSTEGVWIIR